MLLLSLHHTKFERHERHLQFGYKHCWPQNGNHNSLGTNCISVIKLNPLSTKTINSCLFELHIHCRYETALVELLSPNPKTLSIIGIFCLMLMKNWSHLLPREYNFLPRINGKKLKFWFGLICRNSIMAPASGGTDPERERFSCAPVVDISWYNRLQTVDRCRGHKER